MKLFHRRRGRYEIDMTTGPLIPKILQFSLPLMLTGILQLLYNAADVIVVGNFAGHTALAAVSSTGSLINLLVNVFMGLSVGASVVIAQAFGAGDMQRMRRAEHTAMTLALFMGIGVGIMVGKAVGTTVGTGVGIMVGIGVGIAVGTAVGA